MRKLIFLFLLFPAMLYAADTKTTALAELVAVIDTDILYIVDDPGGAPLSKKITVLNLFDTIDTSLKLLTILTNETGTGLSVFATSPTFTTSILAASQADIGSTAAEFGDIFIGDGKAIKFGDDQDVTLTHTADTKLTLNLEFEVDGTLDADGIVELGDGGDNFSLASDGIDIDTSGNITNAGTIGSGAITSTGAIGGTDLTASDDIIGQDDLQLDSDAALIQLGEDQDVTFTHVADTGALLTGTTDNQLQFGDSGTYINQSTDGTLSLVADTIADTTAPNIKLAFDAAAYLNVATANGGVTTISQVSDGADGIVIGDGGDTVAIASAALDLDASGNITNAGTIGSGAITSTGAVGGTDLTASDDIIGQDDLQLDSDAALIQLGEDQDVVLTHVADTGILFTGGTDEQLQFGDSATFIHQSTDGTLSLLGDTIIDATAPNIRLMVDAAAYLNIATADGGITTISQVSDGTDEIAIGDGGDLVSVASGNWDVSNAGVFSGMTGITSTGDIDFGGADLELPQGQTPDTDGDVDLDFTDGSLVIQHGSAHAELGAATDVVMGKLIKSFSATIFAPDGVNDVIPVKPIVAGEFPHGVVVTEVHMVVGTDVNYTIDVENWDDFDTISAGNPSINSTAYTQGNNGEVTDSAITFATIAAGQIIMIDIPATDIDWVSITIYYYEPIS